MVLLDNDGQMAGSSTAGELCSTKLQALLETLLRCLGHPAQGLRCPGTVDPHHALHVARPQQGLCAWRLTERGRQPCNATDGAATAGRCPSESTPQPAGEQEAWMPKRMQMATSLPGHAGLTYSTSVEPPPTPHPHSVRASSAGRSPTFSEDGSTAAQLRVCKCCDPDPIPRRREQARWLSSPARKHQPGTFLGLPHHQTNHNTAHIAM